MSCSLLKGFGRRYLEDKIHKSDEVFLSDKPFVKRELPAPPSAAPAAGNDGKKLMRVKSCLLTNFHGRFPRNHVQKINNGNKEENGTNLELYLVQKEKTLPPNSLNFESELFQKPRPPNLIATEPYRRACNFPWKYSFKTIDYQKCTEQFRRVRTACVDLSKYWIISSSYSMWLKIMNVSIIQYFSIWLVRCFIFYNF